MTRPLILLLLTLSLSIPHTDALSWQPPFFIIGTELGQTSNLLFDSTSVDDVIGDFRLAIDQPLAEWLTLFYDVNLSRLTETSDLSSSHQEFGFYISRNSEQQKTGFSALVNSLNYGEYYSTYDRRQLYLGVDTRRTFTQSIQLRGGVNFSSTTYPGYTAGLSVDHNDWQVVSGLNLSFNWPLALDLETGWQHRQYIDNITPLNTSLGYLKLRGSRPLSNRAGLAVQLYLREQPGVEEQELFALSSLGINPGDLLWNGWQTQGTLNYILTDWRMKLGASLQEAHYLETSVIDGQAQRNDTRVAAQLGARRAIPLTNLPLRLWFNIDLYWQDNSSSSSYYTYTAGGLQLGLTLEPF
jgi:hypothetical protein